MVEEEPRYTEEEWAAWEEDRRRRRADEEVGPADAHAASPYARLPSEPKYPPSYRAQAAAHAGFPVAPAAPSAAHGVASTHTDAFGAGGVDHSQHFMPPTHQFPPPAPVYMQPPWAAHPGTAPPQQVVDLLTGQVQYSDQAGNIFWGPPGLMPLGHAPSPVPVIATVAAPAAKSFEEHGKDKGGGGGSGKGKGGGGGYGPQRRVGDEDHDKGKGKGKGEGKSSSSSSRQEAWGPYRTGWLNKCTDLVVLVLREKNSEAWELARAHANSSSMFPLLPTDIKNMF